MGLDLSNLGKTSVVVYPNPAPNSFNVSAQSHNYIMALNGKVISIVNANAKIITIDSGNLAAGFVPNNTSTNRCSTTVKKAIIPK